MPYCFGTRNDQFVEAWTTWHLNFTEWVQPGKQFVYSKTGGKHFQANDRRPVRGYTFYVAIFHLTLVRLWIIAPQTGRRDIAPNQARSRYRGCVVQHRP